MRDRGWDACIGDTHTDPRGLWANLILCLERMRNRIVNFGLTRQRVVALADGLRSTDLAISFTDGFSLSMGLYGPRILKEARPLLIGGFHGLCDLTGEVSKPFSDHMGSTVRLGVGGLDMAFFFGPADREEGIQRYGIPRERAFLFPFGVDTDFWCPGESALAERGFVFAAGSDPKRDYPCLLEAPYAAPTRILTRLKLPVSVARPDIEVIRGSYHNAAVTDSVLRDFYRAAATVVVPVRNVFQPSGYSVTLQAMACGSPVVLSRIKGLWDPEVFISGHNCILVPPGDRNALGAAIERLLGDPDLHVAIGRAARETAVKSFNLKRMDDGLEEMINTAIRLGPRGAA
jgi:glycosyltransferase involved in cell wall biosynthesis